MRVVWTWPAGWRKVALAAVGVAGVAAGGFWLGRGSVLPRAEARPPLPAAAQAPQAVPPADPEPSGEYGRRAVAYIHGSIPITREDLGEYLIARQGADKLELLVNKRIIEHAAHQRGIQVVEAEVNADLAQTIKLLGIPPKDFVEHLLKRYNKNLYEWREDVIRPKLLMTKMVRDRATVAAEDVLKAFESYHGEKVEGRLIMWPKAEQNKVLNDIYPKIRDDEKAFDEVAKRQASPSLASKGGRLDPIGRHSTGDEALERQIFDLQPGQMTSVVESGQWLVVFKCDKRIAPNTQVSLEQERARLEQEIIEKKIQIEIPVLFAELRTQAEPKLYLQKQIHEQDMLRETEQLLGIRPEPGSPVKGPVPIDK